MLLDVQETTYAQLQHRLLHDVHTLLDDADRRVLQDLDLSPFEFAVLQQLDAHEGRRLTDLGTVLLVVKSTITRVVDRLERAGLVYRTSDPEDRRAQRLTLTSRGVQVRAHAADAHRVAVERHMGTLSRAERHQLQLLLTKLRASLAADLHDAAE